MEKMKWSVWVWVCALGICACVHCSRFKVIEKDVLKYYTSDNVMSFQSQWAKMKLPIENAIRQSLITMYGRGEMNVFVKSKPVQMALTRGFLVSDNILQVLIVNPTMREIPMILAPEVHVCLEGNALRVEGGLSKIFIDAEYMLFRNYSAIQYQDLDPETMSPFSLSQVHDVGNLAITAEGCTFLGTGMATLLGSSVNLGYNTFRVTDCKFNIEISTEGTGTPPVMAPYFDKQQGNQLEILMSKPIADEMNTKIQSALISYVNTTAIFGMNKNAKFIYEQRQIFRKCAVYLEKTIRNVNAAMMEKNNGVLRFDDWSLTWNDKEDPSEKSTIIIKDLVISGLDTAYSFNRGGPYHMHNSSSIAEDFYFHTLHMKGKFVLTNGTKTVERDFGGEIPDVHVSVKVEIKTLESKDQKIEQEKSMNKFCTVTSSGFHLAILDIGTSLRERFAAHSIIIGYTYNNVPKRLVEVLSDIFPKAVKLDDSRLLKYAKPNKQQDSTKDDEGDNGADVEDDDGANNDDDEGGDNGGDDGGDNRGDDGGNDDDGDDGAVDNEEEVNSDGKDLEEENEVSGPARKLKKSVMYLKSKNNAKD